MVVTAAVVIVATAAQQLVTHPALGEEVVAVKTTEIIT